MSFEEKNVQPVDRIADVGYNCESMEHNTK